MAVTMPALRQRMVTARVRAGGAGTNCRVEKHANRPVGRAFGVANSIADLIAMRRKMSFIPVRHFLFTRTRIARTRSQKLNRKDMIVKGSIAKTREGRQDG